MRRCCFVWGRDPATFDLSQQVVEAEGSLTWAVPGRVGSSPDKAGTCQHCQMVRVRRAR